MVKLLFGLFASLTLRLLLSVISLVLLPKFSFPFGFLAGFTVAGEVRMDL